MPSSSSSSSSTHHEYPTCYCGLPAPIRKSNTKANPKRRLLGCWNFEKDREKKCKYFYWIDPHPKEKELEAKNEALQSQKGVLELKCVDIQRINEDLTKENKNMKKKLKATEATRDSYKWMCWILIISFIILFFTRTTVNGGNMKYPMKYLP